MKKEKVEETKREIEEEIEEECITPDWEGGFIRRKHKFNKNGFCIFCGKEKTERLIKKNKIKKL